MTKKEFLNKLSKELKGFPEREKRDVILFYQEYLEESGKEKEEESVAKLGDPVKLARQIIAEGAIEREEEGGSTKKNLRLGWIIFLGILALPMALPVAVTLGALLISLMAVILSLVISIGAVVISLVVTGIAMIAAGVSQLFVDPATGIFFLGMGLILLSVSVLVGMGMYWLFAKIILGLVKIGTKIFVKVKERGSKNEDKN